ncbi:MAG TPA: MarR family transcriptional regulator [Caulobacteraceae bacterium]|nr:MarR family transcriptional regulator [Caulobacteraceae bacterium]
MQADQQSPGAYARSLGAAAIGGRLRRLSERIDREAGRLYAEAGVKFEQRWFGVLNLLHRYGALSVGELAGALGVSHASISQIRDSLQRAGLVSATPDPDDARSRRLTLSVEGVALYASLRPLWDALDAVAVELDREAGGVVALLDRLEDALDRRSLVERARQRLGG